MSTNLFSAKDIIVKFQHHKVFDKLNFNINRGEHWLITGKSGSGKSVLLQTIAGNLTISGGGITRNLTDATSSGIQQDFHNYLAFIGSRHHFKNLSNTSDFYYQQRYNSAGSEDSPSVAVYLKGIKTTNNNTGYWQFENTTVALNLTSLLDKQLIKLSNGETKRLMIAAALLKNPVMLLLDNPLSGLDIVTRKNFNQLLTQIAASGITVVMASSVHEIPDIITDIAMLDEGKIVQTLQKKEFDVITISPNDHSVLDADVLKDLFKINSFEPDRKYIAKLTDVVIKYGNNTILNKVNWTILPAERWALLGPNGAGKTTLLSLINGDNPQAYANNIVLFDRKRGTGESIWDIKSKIGFVSPELYQYFPADNSCLQVIESGFYDTLGLFRQSSKTKADLALNWMKALEIDQYARQLLKNIPASAQRLCLLARALVKNPELLILDEPCQGLDEHQQQHFKNVIDAICSISKVTLIYITHYQQEIPDSVNKVLRLDKGEVVGNM
ncbi:ATP-binding cassette domain-containing protein [Mucilaginibacter segetis]|uniref:ATP-binding cassette domain-containing protein n=1 Tax=Mucilaginibacter segetis TaxID=2793071 RepID=A0A934UN44_9SPHI|nr:ATP-binding cassette domain-containing protein [Mucilaginibacter segetis]MBK0379521.1 ATP-binding cassette domain-containing protein [Mucilaginibacter segetis]